MKIDIITIFPEMFKGPFEESILKRAQNKSLVKIEVHDLRKWTTDKHKTVDDRPYGGGAGMVMMVEPIYKAVKELTNPLRSSKRSILAKQGYSLIKTKSGSFAKRGYSLKKPKVILMTPQGQVFKQRKAQELAKLEHLIFICGHYEGVDERVTSLVDEEISIGDYVLTGGELPAMVVVDSVVRLIPGVLGKEESLQEESFSLQKTINKKQKSLLLEYPQYTRPEDFRGRKVPEVLLSGNHAEIAKWRKEQAIKRTNRRRPDLQG